MVETERQWITDRQKGLLIKRHSLYSTIAVLITNDLNRVKELERFALQRGLNLDEKAEKPDVIVWDDWLQLSEIHLDNEGFVVRHPINADDIGDNIGIASEPMEMICKYLDKRLKGKATVVIFRGLVPQKMLGSGTVSERALDRAFNSWSMDDALFDKGSTVCIFIPDKDMIQETVRAKCNVIEIEPSNTEERKEQITNLANAMRYDLSETDIQRLVDITSGLNLQQLESVLIESGAIYNTFNIEHVSKLKGQTISQESILKVAMNGNLGLGFERVGGYHSLKDFTQRNIVSILKDRELANQFGVQMPKGVLVFGMGGTGKTVFAKALAKELALPFVELNVQNIFDKYVGETEKKAEACVKQIDALSPCVVYIDEIDALGGQRGGGDLDGGATRRAMSVLMQWLAKPRNSLVWATTNRVQDLDEAFMRVGRFDYILPQLLPDMDARIEIIKVHLNVVSKIPNSIDNDALKDIASKTEYWTGAELENLVKRASNLAYHKYKDKAKKVIEVDLTDLNDALKCIRVNTEARKTVQTEYVKLAEKFVNDKSFLEQSMAEMDVKKRDRITVAVDEAIRKKVQK